LPRARIELGWPHAIALGMLLVVLVNVAFIYIAVSGADQVVPSYLTERR
jgi:preprotein translocase subunit SecE